MHRLQRGGTSDTESSSNKASSDRIQTTPRCVTERKQIPILKQPVFSSEVLAQDGLAIVFGLVTHCGRSVDRKFEHILETRDSTYKCRVCFRSARVPMSAGP